MKPSEILKAALALFGPEGERWVPHAPVGNEYCSATAVSAASPMESVATLRKCNGYMERVTGLPDYARWNDAQTSFAPIRAAFERAIELAEAEGR